MLGHELSYRTSATRNHVCHFLSSPASDVQEGVPVVSVGSVKFIPVQINACEGNRRFKISLVVVGIKLKAESWIRTELGHLE